MNKCKLCGADKLKKLLDLGNHPVSSHFLKKPSRKKSTYPFVFGQCYSCGVIQILKPIKPRFLVPRCDWIKYNEPEDHLDNLANKICGLPGIDNTSSILGLSYKDETILNRLKKKGLKNVSLINPLRELEIKNKNAGIETVQNKLSSGIINKIARVRGQVDVIVARHIFEHTYNSSAFMKNLRKLLRPGGYVVMEVPCFQKALKSRDYNVLWEEHLLYFTPETFRNFFKLFGFSIQEFKNYSYALENSLVGIVRKEDGRKKIFVSGKYVQKEKENAISYFGGFPAYKKKAKKNIALYRKKAGKIALWGAGHFACFLANVLTLQDHVEFVIDDDANKQGLFMPGSSIPICNPQKIEKDDIKYCLLCMNPENERRIIRNNAKIVKKGIVIKSIFPVSKNFYLKGKKK